MQCAEVHTSAAGHSLDTTTAEEASVLGTCGPTSYLFLGFLKKTPNCANPLNPEFQQEFGIWVFLGFFLVHRTTHIHTHTQQQEPKKSRRKSRKQKKQQQPAEQQEGRGRRQEAGSRQQPAAQQRRQATSKQATSDRAEQTSRQSTTEPGSNEQRAAVLQSSAFPPRRHPCGQSPSNELPGTSRGLLCGP